MTNADVVTTSPTPSNASALDDIIEIFYRPSTVFARRRADPKFWGAFFIVAALMAIGMYLLMTNMTAALESQFNRQMQEMARRNPQMNPDQMAGMRNTMVMTGKIFAVLIAPLGILFLGVFVWLAGKIFGAEMNLKHGMVIATMAWVPRIIGTIIGAVMAMMMSGEQLQGMNAISIGPARFLDPVTASQRDIMLLTRLDVFTIWGTILIGIGLHVIGGLSKGKAATAAFLLWLVATAITVVPAMNQ
jgi:hypothetical protein